MINIFKKDVKYVRENPLLKLTIFYLKIQTFHFFLTLLSH